LAGSIAPVRAGLNALVRNDLHFSNQTGDRTGTLPSALTAL
jgi:hypothetical protein